MLQLRKYLSENNLLRIHCSQTFSSSIRNKNADLSSEDEGKEDTTTLQSRSSFPGYLTREQQYQLRKKIFYKGEYMVLNCALSVIIMIAVFTIVFLSCWDSFNGPVYGLYVMVVSAALLLLVVVMIVKVRLRLARRAPGGYKVNSLVVVNKARVMDDTIRAAGSPVDGSLA